MSVSGRCCFPDPLEQQIRVLDRHSRASGGCANDAIARDEPRIFIALPVEESEDPVERHGFRHRDFVELDFVAVPGDREEVLAPSQKTAVEGFVRVHAASEHAPSAEAADLDPMLSRQDQDIAATMDRLDLWDFVKFHDLNWAARQRKRDQAQRAMGGAGLEEMNDTTHLLDPAGGARGQVGGKEASPRVRFPEFLQAPLVQDTVDESIRRLI